MISSKKNDKLQKKVAEAKQREGKLISELQETKFLAQLANTKVEDLSLYTRRNNLRIYGIREESKKDHAEDELQTETSEENVSRRYFGCSRPNSSSTSRVRTWKQYTASVNVRRAGRHHVVSSSASFPEEHYKR